MDIQKIILKAAYIEERRRGAAYQAAASDRSEGRLEEWKKLLNVAEDGSIYSKRMKFDGISEEEALELCGDSMPREVTETPRWAEIVEGVMKLLPMTVEEADTCSALRRKGIELTGPVAALFPFAAYCEARWRGRTEGQGALAAGLPVEDLSRMLLNRLYQTAYQVFNTKGRFMIFMGSKAENVWEKIEQELLSGGWETLLEEYPVLARRMGTVIEEYLEFVEEFYLRFTDKKEFLAKEFFGGKPVGRIARLEGEISDLHQDGRCVLVLAFEDDRKLVYKPRSLEIDVNWERFLKSFPEAAKHIKAPHAVDFGHYGFVEHIKHEPCAGIEEVKAYFSNAGALMALLHALGGNDFHRENIIAAGPLPVIIDTETLMIPVARPFEQGGKDKEEDRPAKPETLAEMLESSINGLGMLPLNRASEGKGFDDFGALTGTDDKCDNLPVFDGKKCSAARFSDQVEEGFRQMYRQILNNRERLLKGSDGIRLFAGCKFRMLIRTSQVYANVIQHIHRSMFLKDGFEYSLQTERMVNAFLYTAKEEIIPGLLKVFKSEKAALENGNIPIFYSEPGGEGILDHRELLYPNYFSRNALEKAEDSLRNMDEAGLAIQLQIIKRSLAAAELGDIHTAAAVNGQKKPDERPKKPVTSEELIREAETIFRDVMDDRIKAPNGDYSWLTAQYDIKLGGSSMGLMSPALYDGMLGIAVFAGALYRVTGNPVYKETADYCADKISEVMEEMIPVLERYQAPLGYGSGVGGYLAGLELTAEYTGSEKAAETAEKLLSNISENCIKNDGWLDVLGGVSGLAMVLARRKNLSDQGRQVLEWCGNHLLAKRIGAEKEGYRVWESKHGSRPLTGLGHGAAGVALALTGIWKATGNNEYLDAAKEAVAYENSVFDQVHCNWPDFRTKGGGSDLPKPGESAGLKFMMGYCSGAPGVGLSRLGMLTAVPGDAGFTEILLDDIGRADRFIRDYTVEIRDHICCGRTAGIDFLIEKSIRLGDPEAMELAKGRMGMLLDEKEQRKRYCLIGSDGKFLSNITLFQGTAGIGYEMLRLAAPETIHTILI